MERNEALELVKGQLPEKRYVHTIGVMEMAISLAKKYGADVKKAELAAIFHDYAKYRPKEELRQIIIDEKLPPSLLHFHSELWHGPAGAFLVKKEAGINDEEILTAIAYHTTGRENMSLLEKVIYLADYIEPGRNFPGVAEVRDLAEIDLDKAMLKSLQNTIAYLVQKGSLIYPDTVHAYNDFARKQED